MVARRYAEPLADAVDGLMVTGVYLQLRLSEDLCKVAFRFQEDLMSRETFVFGLHVVAGQAEMLRQRAAVMNVQQLHAAADGENRNVGVESLVEKTPFDFIAFVVGWIYFGLGRLFVELGIDVGPAHQD